MNSLGDNEDKKVKEELKLLRDKLASSLSIGLILFVIGIGISILLSADKSWSRDWNSRIVSGEVEQIPLFLFDKKIDTEYSGDKLRKVYKIILSKPNRDQIERKVSKELYKSLKTKQPFKHVAYYDNDVEAVPNIYIPIIDNKDRSDYDKIINVLYGISAFFFMWAVFYYIKRRNLQHKNIQNN
jgi:hypothetical protein